MATYCRLSALSPTLDEVTIQLWGKKKQKNPLWTVNWAFSEHTSLRERFSKCEGNALKTVVHLKGQSVLSIKGCFYLHSNHQGRKTVLKETCKSVCILLVLLRPIHLWKGRLCCFFDSEILMYLRFACFIDLHSEICWIFSPDPGWTVLRHYGSVSTSKIDVLF